MENGASGTDQAISSSPHRAANRAPMRRQLSDWFAPKNKSSPVSTSDDASGNTRPLSSPLSASRKVNHSPNTVLSPLRTVTNGPTASGKRVASSVNSSPTRAIGTVTKAALSAGSAKRKLQQKLTFTSTQQKLTVVGGPRKFEDHAKPTLSSTGADCDGTTPSPMRNNSSTLSLEDNTSSQDTLVSCRAVISSVINVDEEGEKQEVKESSEDTTPASTRSVSTSKTDDVPTPSSFRSAVETLDGELSSVVELSSSPVRQERTDKGGDDGEQFKQLRMDNIEVIVLDDSQNTEIAMASSPAQKNPGPANVESSSVLSSPPSSLVSMTLTSESARPVDIIALNSESEFDSSSSPEPTPTPTAITRGQIAARTEATGLEETVTTRKRQLRSSALASILSSSRPSAAADASRSTTEPSSFVIEAPLLPPSSPSTIVVSTQHLPPNTPGPAEIQIPKEANRTPSSFLESLIQKSARKPVRTVKPAIPSALRDLYAHAAEIQRFDSLMAESKELELQSDRLEPRSDEAIDDNVMKVAVGEENAMQVAEMLAKAEREKSKNVEFHYFDIGQMDQCETESIQFPGLPAGWVSECLNDPEMRNVMFESGFVRDMIDLGNKLPKTLVWYLVQEVSRERNDFLAHSYLQTLLLCDDILNVNEEVLDQVFHNLGIKSELRHDDSELTLSPIKDDASRFHIHNIKFTIELLHAIVTRRTYERHFFRKVIIFTIRSLLDSAVGKSLYSSLSDLFSIVLSRIPMEDWVNEERFLLRILFSSVTDSKERVRLLTLVPINPGTYAMHLRTRLAIAFFLNDVDFVVDTMADNRLPIAKRILPELLSNPLYRLRTASRKNGAETPQAQPCTRPLSGPAEAELQKNDLVSPSHSKPKVVVSKDLEDEPDQEMLESTSAISDDIDDIDDIELDTDSEEDDDESSEFDYVLLTQRICCLNFALMTAVRFDKDMQKIKVVTDFLRDLNNKIFDPQARFPDRTEAKTAVQACEFRLLYSVVGGNGVRQSVIEKHFEYLKRSPRKNHRSKKRKEIEE
ncbi:hypothetical protein V1525DRAFT_392445 [Lipomyces kononenkoae]|uniref:Uncharacterized protein n=1 Tax=Lipomyces kononenkoae TaxID=34357 RepID=A0ACC3TBR5_LIPKO